MRADTIEERTIRIANYIIETKCTVSTFQKTSFSGANRAL